MFQFTTYIYKSEPKQHHSLYANECRLFPSYPAEKKYLGCFDSSSEPLHTFWSDTQKKHFTGRLDFHSMLASEVQNH